MRANLFWLFYLCSTELCAEMMAPTPIDAESAAVSGVCLLEDCRQNWQFSDRLSAERHRQLQADPRPWARALSTLCEIDVHCPPTHFNLALKHSEPIFLPYSTLKRALEDHDAPVRAMALMRLDLASAGAVAAAERLLDDAAWVSPQPFTVADHAYARLHPEIVLHQIESAQSKIAATLPVPRLTNALNRYRGLALFSHLRAPDAPQSLAWQAAILAAAHNADAQLDPATLASFWRFGTRTEFEVALEYASLDVRLLAFDALLIRYAAPNPGALAVKLFKKGGVRKIGSCIQYNESVAVVIFKALRQTDDPHGAQIFLDSLATWDDGGNMDRFTNPDPRQHIANHLAGNPRLAKMYAASLRLWANANVPYVTGTFVQ
jgi:hypothetical protein